MTSSVHECCCCCISPPPVTPASVSSTDVTDDVMKQASVDRVPLMNDEVMDCADQRGSSSKKVPRERKLSSSTSSVQRVHKKFSVLDSFDIGDDSVFVADQTATILVLYCGGTIGMRSRCGGTRSLLILIVIRDAMRKRGLCCRLVSVCPSVRHVGVLYPDG